MWACHKCQLAIPIRRTLTFNPTFVVCYSKSGSTAHVPVEIMLWSGLEFLTILHSRAAVFCARALDDEAIKAELTRFKGVGPKTVACVLMFCLERPEFPVDVHVRFRVHPGA